MKRSLSFALLALHLLVFVLGGALSSASTASNAAAAGHRVVVVASGYGIDGSTVAPPQDGRLELGTRARGDRGERGTGTLAIDAIVARGLVTIAPAGLVGLRDWRSAARGHGSLPCVVNGARGPPLAAV
ncbi:MAG: hypothetical protein JWO86_3368 [Myxococcaceae bacterium]|nr:hypothetical protein [Myxococcaceae bacterium]